MQHGENRSALLVVDNLLEQCVAELHIKRHFEVVAEVSRVVDWVDLRGSEVTRVDEEKVPETVEGIEDDHVGEVAAQVDI